MSTPRTPWLEPSKANWREGRPPVEAAFATELIRPMRTRASTRAATVDRANPVRDANSERVRDLPSRRIWKISDCAEPDRVSCPRGSIILRYYLIREEELYLRATNARLLTEDRRNVS